MSTSKDLTFSVVIPTLDRPSQLTGCLEALAAMDYPQDRFEVVVVQDGRADGLNALSAQRDGRLKVTVLRQEHAGPASARNTGAAIAKGRYLAFTDDDCRPAAGWLAAFDAKLQESPDAGLGGATTNALEDNPYSAASHLITEVLLHRLNSEQAHFLPSNNLCVPAEEFRALGGFDSSYRRAAGEDREFCRRWLTTGHRLFSVPSARVAHAHPMSLRSFWRQHYAYGQGSCLFHQPEPGQPPSGFEDWSFYRDLLLSPFERSNGIEAAPGTALVALAQLATAAGFLTESVMKGFRDGDNESSAT